MHHFSYRNGVLHAEDVSLARLADEVGTPFYCYSTATLERHYKVLSQSFQGSEHLICFAVKANSNQAVLQTMARLGAGMDVVSEGELRRANAAGTQEAFELLRGQFQTLADDREKAQQTASAALEAAFDFMEQAFAESQEMVVFVTELTVNPVSHAFLTENGCERYFQYNKDLLLDHRKAALQQELAAEQRRHGGM